jgi:hypothetical protein
VADRPAPSQAGRNVHARQGRLQRASQAMAAFGLRTRVNGPSGQLVCSFFLSLPFFSFSLSTRWVFWPNQISPWTPFVDYVFLYLFLLNKYLLIQLINKH